MAKLVVISDTHIHDWKAFGGSSGFENVRLQQTLKVVRDSLEKASELGAVWVHAGDIIHTTGFGKHPITSSVVDLLSDYPEVPKVIIWGNHDSRSRGGKIKLEESFQYVILNSVPNTFVLDESDYTTEDGIRIWGCGAQPDLSLLNHEHADVGVFHDFVKGAKLPSGITLSSGIPKQDLLEHYRLSIVGDIHTPHLHEEDGRYVLIPGSPEQHKFGETGDRGWYIVDIDTNDINIESVVSDSPKFITVDDSSEIRDDGNYYRVIGSIKGDIPENTKVVSSSPDVVETRDVFSISDDINSILEKWIELNPPPEGDNELYLNIAKELVAEQDIIIPQDHKLVSVSGENFCSYEEFKYEVDTGVTLVVGTSDRFNSNGAGKSTLFEAIFWCLFGKTTKGQGADEVIRWGKKKCKVELEIALNSGKTLTITRERTPQLSLSADIDGVAVSGDTNRDLEAKILGILCLNELLFLSLAYFSQEDVTLISQGTDAEIKNLISDLAGLSGFQEAATSANQLHSEKEDERSRLGVILEQKQDEIERKKNSINEIEDKIKRFRETQQERVDSLTSKLEVMKGRLEDYENRSISSVEEKASRLKEQAEYDAHELAESVYEETYEAKLQSYKENIKQLEKKLDEYPTVDESKEDIQLKIKTLEERIKKGRDKVNELRDKTSTLSTNTQTKKYELKTQTKKLKEIETGVCPECGQPLSSDDNIKVEIEGNIKTLKAEVEDLEEKEDKLKAVISKAKKRLSDLEALVSGHRELLSVINDINATKDKLDTAKANAKASSNSEAKVVAKNQRDSYLKDRISLIDSRVRRAKTFLTNKRKDLSEKVSRMEKEIQEEENRENPHEGYLEQTIEDVEELENAVKTISVDREEILDHMEVYKYWNTGFGKTGIQSLLMDEIAGEFNKARSRIFPTLTNGYYDVQMSTTSETKAGEKREKLSFLVFDEGTEVPYTSLSGGQKRRVDVGVLLTMTAAICQSYGISGLLGIMILDEVVSYVDASGAESVAETLEEYVDFAVPSIYLISHDTNLQSLFNQIIEVEIKDKVSRIL